VKVKTPEEAQKNHCFCIECDYTCRRIKELREHLSKHHLYTFRSEDLEFENAQGKFSFIF
jgi:uncharacterized C2H2 Zn-finger protein